jgi:hypothetical protein
MEEEEHGKMDGGFVKDILYACGIIIFAVMMVIFST